MATLLNVHQLCPDECSMLQRSLWLLAILRIRDILVRIRICLFLQRLTRCQQIMFFLSFSAFYFLKVHLHKSSKIKSQKEVKKMSKSRFLLLFWFVDGRIRIRINNDGSGSSKNKRILRIRFHTTGL
jgi:ABC-type uncharacterized transport system permease subunit